MSEPPITVVVVDDHRVVRETMRVVIDAEPGLECVGIAGTVSEAVELVDEHRPEVVLMDVRLAGADGTEGIRRILARRPPTRVIAFTGELEAEVVRRAADAGACGFLSKQSPVRGLLDGIRATADGGVAVDTASLSTVRRHATPVSEGTAGAPTATEEGRRTLRLLRDGLTTDAMAAALGVDRDACTRQVGEVVAALGARHPFEALLIAVERGLVEVPAAPA